jgi:two-component system sensor histidine kinase DegS
LGRQAAVVAENVRLMSSLRRRIHELEQLRNELKATHYRLLLSREEERKRLARELHDRLLQTYLGLNVEVDVLLDLVEGPQQMAHLTALEQKIRLLASETRRICTDLRPSSLGIVGLAATIRSYTERWAEQHPDIRVTGGFSDRTMRSNQTACIVMLDLVEDRKRLPGEVEITLFRVYQEALANIAKHAASRHVWVKERLTETHVELSIRDDGRGFARPAHIADLTRQGRFGLLGVSERMAAIGGEIEITSEPGQGTKIWVRASLGREE